MAYEHNDNSGSIFVNDKGDNPNRPDMKGSAKIDGKLYWVSAWSKKKENGEKWLSLSVQPQEASAPAPASSIDDSDEMPF